MIKFSDYDLSKQQKGIVFLLEKIDKGTIILNESQKDVLIAQLGLTIMQKEYKRVETKCSFCGGSKTEFFEIENMASKTEIQRKQAKLYKKVELTFTPFPPRITDKEIYHVSYCKRCEWFLNTLSKQEIIEKTLELLNKLRRVL